jgi:hypothetical protein
MAQATPVSRRCALWPRSSTLPPPAGASACVSVALRGDFRAGRPDLVNAIALVGAHGFR